MQFLTGFSFLTIRPHLRQNDSCAECYCANYEQQDNCARCFAQVLDSSQKALILINRSVAHAVSHMLQPPNNTGLFQGKRQLCSVIWGQFRATGKLLTAFFTRFGFLTIRVNLKQNDSCAESFDANFEQQDSCARCFGQVLAFFRNVAHLKQNDSCAV